MTTFSNASLWGGAWGFRSDFDHLLGNNINIIFSSDWNFCQTMFFSPTSDASHPCHTSLLPFHRCQGALLLPAAFSFPFSSSKLSKSWFSLLISVPFSFLTRVLYNYMSCCTQSSSSLSSFSSSWSPSSSVLSSCSGCYDIFCILHILFLVLVLISKSYSSSSK